MRRSGPLFLVVVVVALVASAAWYVLRSPSLPLAESAHSKDGGGASGAEGVATADAPAGPDRVELPSPPLPPVGTGPNSVRGQVRYAADQRPASGARVRAFRSPPPLRSRKLSQQIRNRSSDRKAAAEQDLSEFEGDDDGGGSRSGARGGSSGSGVSVEVTVGDDSVGKDGDALVEAAGGDVGETLEKEAEKADGAPADPKHAHAADRDAPLAVAIAGRDGSFELLGLDGGAVHVDAVAADAVSSSDERVDFEASPARDGVVLQLVPGARVRGRVHDEEGKAVAGATVTLSAGFDPFSMFAEGGMEIASPASVRTDANGAFLFDPVIVPRVLQVRAYSDAFAPAPAQKLELQPGDERTVDLLLSHGATLEVRVTDGSGAPLSDATCKIEPTKINLTDLTTDSGRFGRGNVMTGADGVARFVGVASGDWRVRASLAGRLEAVKSVAAGGPGSEQQVELALATGRTLTGVVVARDGTPVAGARVTAFVEPSLLKMSTLTSAAGRPKATSDEQGRFTLAGLPAEKLLCEASAKGYRTERAPVGKDAAEVRVELATRGAIEGIVVSKKTGKPVARYDFKVVREKKSTNFMDPEMSKSFFDVTVPIASPNGKFRLTGVTPGRLRLLVHAAEHGEKATDWIEMVEGETKRGVVVFLEAEAVIEGLVVDANGAPVAGAGVRREADANPIEAMMSRMFTGDDAQSDAEGRFRIGELSAGVTRLVASRDGFIEAASGDLELAAGQHLTTLRLELARGGEIWGVVSDPNGAPRPGASVMCQETARLKMRTLKSDARGEFHFKGLPAGSFSLIKMPDNIDLGGENFIGEMTNAMETHTVRLKAGETQRVDFTGRKAGGAAVEGRVTQRGAGVGGAIVMAYSNPSGAASAADGSTTVRSATTAADGTYEIADVPAGSGYVEVKGEDGGVNGGGSAALLPVKFVDGETARVDLVIPTGSLSGKVVDAASGAPLPGIAVYAASTDPGASTVELATRRAAAIHTDANGQFALKNLRSGRFVLTAGATDLMASGPADHAVIRTAPLEVKEGRDSDAGTIRLPRGGRIEGTLVGADGKGLSGASVFLRGGDGEFLEEWTATTSDANGHFEYGGVPNGTWDVVARAPGRATAVARNVGVGEGSVASVRLELIGGTEVFADIGDVAIERLFSLKVEVDGPDGRIPLTLFGLGDLTDLLAHPPRSDVVRLGRFGPGDYRVSGTIEGKAFERKFTLKGEPELHVPVELPR